MKGPLQYLSNNCQWTFILNKVIFFKTPITRPIIDNYLLNYNSNINGPVKNHEPIMRQLWSYAQITDK